MANLSYKFEVEAGDGLDKIVAGLGTADRGVEKLSASARGAAGAIGQAGDAAKKAGGEFEGVGRTVESLKSHVSNFFDFVGATLAVEAIKKVGEAFIDLGKEAINAAAGAERVGLSFDFTLGTEGAKDMLGWIEKIAGKTEFTDDQLKGWTLQLANAGLKGEALKDNVAAILDVAAKRGPQGAEAAVDALSRATLSGKIEGRALRGLGIPVADLAQLDQFKGLNEKQINKKLETATVSKDDLLALIAGPDKLLGDFAVKASDTMSAKLTHLRDLPDQFFQQLAKGQGFAKLSTTLGSLLEKLDPESPSGRKISEFFEKTFEAAADAIGRIDFDSLVGALNDDVLPAIKSMADMIAPTVTAVERIVRGFHELHDIAFGPAVKNSALDDFDRRQKAAIEHAAKEDEHPSFLDKGADVGGGAKAWHGKFNMVGSDATNTLAGAVNGNLGVVGDAGAGMGQALMDGLDQKIERHSPPRVFLRVGQDIPRAVALGIESEQGTLDDAIASSISLPSPDSTGVPMGGSTSISIGPIEVHMGGAVEPQQAQAAGDALADQLEARLQAFFERKRLEQRT